jgi:hypothetical protein
MRRIPTGNWHAVRILMGTRFTNAISYFEPKNPLTAVSEWNALTYMYSIRSRSSESLKTHVCDGLSEWICDRCFWRANL